MRQFGIGRLLIPVAAAILLVAIAPRIIGAEPSDADRKIDISQPGTYRSGLWEYKLIVSSPGSRSEGTIGKLFFDGKPLEEPSRGDYYRTPWGDVQWVGNPSTLWGEHGWVLRSPLVQGGRALADPLFEAGGPVVMLLVLRDAPAAPAPPETIDPWVKDEMTKLGAGAWRIQQPWAPLTDQSTTLHDTKMFGSLKARLLPARSRENLTIAFEGSDAGRLDLPRKDGATRLVKRSLNNSLRDANFYLAFRVERAALDWPRPLDIGPDADGREIAVKGAKEVIISLPGNLNSGLAWSIKSLQGDAPTSSSIRPWGQTQFTRDAENSGGPERKGTFETTLRVVGLGKTYVELEHKRPWQTDQPAEKTWKVTLDVQELPPSPKPARP